LRGPHIGFALYYATTLFRERERLERIATLLLDERWPWSPSYGSFLPIPGKRARRAQRRFTKKSLGSLIEELSRLEFCAATLLTSIHESTNFASISIETGQEPSAWNGKFPFHMDGQTLGAGLPAGKSLSEWINLVHDLAEAADAVNGVMCVWPTAQQVLTDITLTDVGLGIPEPFNAQRRRTIRWRAELGDKFVRHPRWGTYLQQAVVEALGGTDHIRKVAQPALIRRVGDLVFVQLTRSPAKALESNCEVKRRALERLMSPLLVPPMPSS